MSPRRRRRPWARRSSTTPGSTSPSKGQPKATLTVPRRSPRLDRAGDELVHGRGGLVARAVDAGPRHAVRGHDGDVDAADARRERELEPARVEHEGRIRRLRPSGRRAQSKHRRGAAICGTRSSRTKLTAHARQPSGGEADDELGVAGGSAFGLVLSPSRGPTSHSATALHVPRAAAAPGPGAVPFVAMSGMMATTPTTACLPALRARGDRAGRRGASPTSRRGGSRGRVGGTPAGMRALARHGPERMSVVEMLDPEPGRGEVLLVPEAVGICGSEVEGYLGRQGNCTPPLVMGHEFADGSPPAGDGALRREAGGRRASSTRSCPIRRPGRASRTSARAGSCWACTAPAASRAPSAYRPAPALPGDADPRLGVGEPLANGVHAVRIGQSGAEGDAGAPPSCWGGHDRAHGAPGGAAGRHRLGRAEPQPARRPRGRARRASGLRHGRRRARAAVREATGGEGADLIVDAAGVAATRRWRSSSCGRAAARSWSGWPTT